MSADTTAREKQILEHNRLLKERIALLTNIRRQAKLLEDYFSALADLAGAKDATTLGTRTSALAKELGELAPEIKAARVGGDPVADFAGPVAKLTVARFQQAALERELKARSGIIAQNLELQEAAFQAMARSMKTDLQLKLNTLETNEVVLPYSGSKALPAKWDARRREILSSQPALEALDAAAVAAGKMKESFAALCAGKFSPADYTSILKEAEEVAALAGKIAADPGKKR